MCVSTKRIIGQPGRNGVCEWSLRSWGGRRKWETGGHRERATAVREEGGTTFISQQKAGQMCVAHSWVQGYCSSALVRPLSGSA